MDLALVHTAHFLIRHRLNCLSLLLQAKPDVLQELLNAFCWDEDEMVSHRTLVSTPVPANFILPCPRGYLSFGTHDF